MKNFTVPGVFCTTISTASEKSGAARSRILEEAIFMLPDIFTPDVDLLADTDVLVVHDDRLASVIEDMADAFGISIPRLFLVMTRYLHLAASSVIVQENADRARAIRETPVVIEYRRPSDGARTRAPVHVHRRQEEEELVPPPPPTPSESAAEARARLIQQALTRGGKT